MDSGTGLGAGNNTYYEKGFNAGSTAAGLPPENIDFGSATDANHTFEFASNGPGQNDALMLDTSSPSGTLTLSGSTKYSQLSFLLAGANGGTNDAPLSLTINYAGGGTQTATISGPDWFFNTPIAVNANGRSDVFGNFDSDTNGNPRIYQQDLTLTDTVDRVTSVNFSYPGGNRVVVYGLSGQALPVPSRNMGSDRYRSFGALYSSQVGATGSLNASRKISQFQFTPVDKQAIKVLPILDSGDISAGTFQRNEISTLGGTARGACLLPWSTARSIPAGRHDGAGLASAGRRGACGSRCKTRA